MSFLLSSYRLSDGMGLCDSDNKFLYSTAFHLFSHVIPRSYLLFATYCSILVFSRLFCWNAMKDKSNMKQSRKVLKNVNDCEEQFLISQKDDDETDMTVHAFMQAGRTHSDNSNVNFILAASNLVASLRISSNIPRMVSSWVLDLYKTSLPIWYRPFFHSIAVDTFTAQYYWERRRT